MNYDDATIYHNDKNGRTGGRTVTWLPKFLGWVDDQIFLPMVHRCARFALVDLRYEPLNNCITVLSFESWRYLNVMLLNTFSCNKRRKNCDGSKWWSQSSLVWPLAMPCLDAKISLVPKHQFIVPSTLLAPATEIRTHKAIKVHTLRQLPYELFFQCKFMVA